MSARAFTEALRRVRRVVDEMGRLPGRLSQAAAPALTDELQRQFAEGRDPYGYPWAPLKPSTLRKHGPPPLTDTRRLRDGTKAVAMRAGIKLIAGAPYGAFHQLGFRVGRTRVPARRILPNLGMPRAWREILDRTAKRLAQEARA